MLVLSPSDRAAFDGATKPATIEMSSHEENHDVNEPEAVTSKAKVAAASGCRSWHYTGYAKATFGNMLYTFWQTTTVCASGGRVTSVAVSDLGGETRALGWRIAKSPTKATKNVSWEGRGLGQYYFVLGAGGWDVQHPSSCLQVRINANLKDRRMLLSCDLAA